MKKVPISIILKSDSNIEFSNEDANIILKEKEPGIAPSSTSRDMQTDRNAISSKITLSALKKLKLEDRNISLYDIILEDNPSRSLNDENKFIRKEEKEELYYEAFCYSPITFNLKKCLPIFIKDVTSSIKLLKQASSEKHTKIYIASVTHDLRTPVNGMVGMLDCISSHTNDPYIHDCIKIAKNSSEMLLLLIRDILDLSQLESNSVRLNFENVNIIELVNESSDLFAKDFSFKKLESKVKISPNFLGEIYTDKMRYKQILCNLLSNALKYTMKGSIKIKLKYDSKSETLKSIVKDTGVGISKENISKLFNLFGKLEENKSLNPHGIGLGLTICKKFSELLGGSISVKSEINKGSSFIFTIKNKQSQTMLDKKRSSSKRTFSPFLFSPSRMASGAFNFPQISECPCPKLLFVDDNPTNLCVLSGYLRNKPIQADIANNGIECLEKVDLRARNTCCKSYNMIWMDINMPIMGGFEATKLIREKEDQLQLHKTLIYACTADPILNEDECNHYKKSGFDNIIVKPVSKKTFEECIKFNLGINF